MSYKITSTSALVFLLFWSSSLFAQPYYPYPDTGQSKCYGFSGVEITCPPPGDHLFGQDFQYQPRLPRSYSKIGAGGVVLPDTAEHIDNGGEWLMTRDNVTGLIWELKTARNAGFAFDWPNAIQQVEWMNEDRYGGFSDWRLPTRHELASLVNRGAQYPPIDIEWFPNTANAGFWTSTQSVDNPDKAWFVSFSSVGVVEDGDKSRAFRVRAVRGQGVEGELIDNNDGTVTDIKTGLTWQKETAPDLYNWQEALMYAEGLTLAGYSDWRLPNINELQTLVDVSHHSPAVSPVLKNYTLSQSAHSYWSSTTHVDTKHRAWLVSFAGGQVGTTEKPDKRLVRVVRSTGDVPPPVSIWETEIGVINSTDSTLSGTLRGFDSTGNQVWTYNVSLTAHGRLELDIAQAAGSVASNIKSLRFDITGGQALGYQKLYQAGQHRVGLEAQPRANQNALYLPHIHSDDEWWTGVGLVNTTTGAKNLNFSFSDGVAANRLLNANSHDSFTIEALRGATPFIGSAQALDGAGVAGLMLFSSDRTLSGVSLSDTTTTTLFFPHVDQNGWWTGIGIYNPNAVPTELAIIGYDRNGNQTDATTETVAAFGNKVFATTFSFSTAWFTVQSTQPVTGFELFGTDDGNQLAGYSVVNLATTSGVFPKLERSGWTGIAVVNVGEGPATITLEARNDSGSVVASRVLTLEPKAKEVLLAENFFPGQNMGSATYVRFTSDQPVVGFQLNGSADRTMLDAIPALGATHVGTQQLYFPHIHAD